MDGLPTIRQGLAKQLISELSANQSSALTGMKSSQCSAFPSTDTSMDGVERFYALHATQTTNQMIL